MKVGVGEGWGLSDLCSRLLLQLAVIFLLLLSTSYALYEDQIGKWDWRSEYVGRVNLWAVDGGGGGGATTSTTKAVYVGTHSNVVAALDASSGGTLWRSVLEEKGSLALLLAGGGSVVAVSTGGERVRVWEARTGLLKWESLSAEGSPCGTEAVAGALDKARGRLLLLRCGRVTALELGDGETVWEADLPLLTSKRDRVWSAIAVQSKDSVLVFGGKDGDSLTALTLDAGSGKLRSSESGTTPWLSLGKCRLLVSTLLCPDSATASAKLFSASAEVSDGGKLAKGGGGPGLELKLWALEGGYYGLSLADNFALYKLGSTEPLLSLETGPVDVSMATHGGSEYLGLVREGANEVQELEWRKIGGGLKWSSKWGVGPTRARIARALPIHKREELSWLLLCEDGVVSRGSGSWSRHEALAESLSVEMVDLPLSEAQASVEVEFADEEEASALSLLRHRLSSQYEQISRTLRTTLDHLLTLDASASTEGLFGLLGPGSKKAAAKSAKLERDEFNLNKVLVVSTSLGKLYGLDSRDGRILWELWTPALKPLLNSVGQVKLSVLLQRSTAHYPHPAQAVAIGKDAETGRGLLVRFEPISGRLLGEEVLDWPLKSFQALPYSSHDGLSGLLLIGAEEEVRVLPADIQLPPQPNIHHFFVEPKSGMMRGVRLIRSGDGWALEEMWRNRLPLLEAQRLLEVGVKPLSQALHSPGRALGDRSVLYKYSNPNVVSVVALSPEVAGAGAGGAAAGGLLSLFLVDVITGHILHSIQHPRVTQPLHLVHAENWLVYSFWNEKARRTEVATLELYEGKSQTRPEEFSSFAAPHQKPLVLSQSYIFQQGISALGLTDTEKGMTNRHLLFAMPFGGILEMPKGLLDPRRALTPTPEAREEGLPPYIPELPIATEHILNYNQSLLRVKAMECRPGGLESTSLLFVRGLDLYFTRLTPSGTFDVLKDDFDHWVIAVVLAALTIATFVSRRLARARDLQQNWK